MKSKFLFSALGLSIFLVAAGCNSQQAAQSHSNDNNKGTMMKSGSDSGMMKSSK